MEPIPSSLKRRARDFRLAGLLLAALAAVLFAMTLRAELYFDGLGYIRFQEFYRLPWRGSPAFSPHARAPTVRRGLLRGGERRAKLVG